jgi:hypothetical protein
MTLTSNQIIPQSFAQSAQCIADGWLRNGQIPRRLGQAFFGHDFVKDTKQVQV